MKTIISPVPHCIVGQIHSSASQTLQLTPTIVHSLPGYSAAAAAAVAVHTSLPPSAMSKAAAHQVAMDAAAAAAQVASAAAASHPAAAAAHHFCNIQGEGGTNLLCHTSQSVDIRTFHPIDFLSYSQSFYSLPVSYLQRPITTSVAI